MTVQVEPAPAKTTPPWVFWLTAVLLVPVIIFAIGIGAGFNAAHVEDGGAPSLLPYLPAGLLCIAWALVVGFGLRALRRRAAQRRWSGPQTFLAVVLASLGLGAVLGVTNALVSNEWVGLTLRMVVFGLGLALTVIYWRRIDEAAREAQKSSWFWGSAAGVTLSLIAEPLIRTAEGRPNLPVLFGDGSSHDWLLTGAAYILFAQALGGLLAWSAWWIRAR